MKYGIVYCDVWDNPEFKRLSPKGMLALIFLWTHQHRNSCGLYRSSVVALGDLYPRPIDEFIEGITEAHANGFVFIDHKHKVLLLHSYVKYCHPGNLNIMKSWLPIIAKIPSESALKRQWYDETLKSLKQGFAEPFGEWFEAECRNNSSPETAPEQKEAPAPTPIIQIVEQNEPQTISKPPKPKKQTDEEFIDALRNNTAYRGLDIDVELGKMDAWIQANGGHRARTRKFIVNWLNRASNDTRDIAVNRCQNGQSPARKLTQHGQRNAAVVQQMIQRKRGGEGDA